MPAEFGRIFEIALTAGQAGASTAPAASSESTRSRAKAESPFTRAALALRQHFGDETAHLQSALWRFYAVMALYRRGALGPWVRRSPRRPEVGAIHPAVLDVAARMRLSNNGKLPIDKFLAEVERVARTTYQAPGGWLPGDAP